MERRRYLIKFYYIGSKKYFGSQRQIESETIEKHLIHSLLKKKYINNIKTAGFEVASRTDKFVSARGACFSFLTNKNLTLMEINSILPRDIGLWAFCEVDHNFSSRFNAIYRFYKYIFRVPEKKNGSYSYNLKLVKKACKVLEGHHDFLNFSKREKNSIKTTRDMILSDFEVDGPFLIFNFKSKAFLRQQIRRMVAKVLEVGKGVIDLDDFIQLFDTQEYISYQPADPTGLILWDIYYGENVNFTIDIKSYERMLQYFSKKFYSYNLKQKLFEILQHNDLS